MRKALSEFLSKGDPEILAAHISPARARSTPQSGRPRLQAVMLEIEEDMKVHAEGAIAAAIKAGDMPTVRWFAERKMRDRGYGSRVDVEIDTAALEKLADLIAETGGLAGLRAARAILAGYGR